MSVKSVSLPRRGSLLSTRRGNLIIAVAAAVLAVILLVVFLHNYRHSLTNKTPTRVIVTDRLIPKGASADVLEQDGTSLHVESLPHNQLKAGAISSGAALNGKIAAHDIFPGEQITAADFVKPSDPLLAQVQGDSRVISLPLDVAHGLIGQIHPGDDVDVVASFTGLSTGGQQTAPFTRLLARDVLVLAAPAHAPSSAGVANTTTQSQNVTLRVTSAEASTLAYASDNGKIWLVLRPKTDAVDSAAAAQVTINRLLNDSAPVRTPNLTGKGKP